MSQRHGWDIRTRMLAISLGPALLLTLLLTAYFTYSRLQDLRQELTHTGQLIADQLAPAAEYGVIAGNTPVLQKLLQATLDTPHVRFIEVRDGNDNILVYVEQLSGALQNAAPIDIFHSTIQRQRIALASDPLLDGASGSRRPGGNYLGRVVVGMSNDAFSQRQQEILLKAALLAAFAPDPHLPRRTPPGAAPVGADQHHGPGGRGDPERRLQDQPADPRRRRDRRPGPVTSTISPAGWTARAGNRNRRSAN